MIPATTIYRIQPHRSRWLFWLRRWQAETVDDYGLDAVRAHTRRGIERRALALAIRVSTPVQEVER